MLTFHYSVDQNAESEKYHVFSTLRLSFALEWTKNDLKHFFETYNSRERGGGFFVKNKTNKSVKTSKNGQK